MWARLDVRVERWACSSIGLRNGRPERSRIGVGRPRLTPESSSAFKIDPDAGTWQQYAGLTGPYTYSDMTGWGLSLVTPG